MKRLKQNEPIIDAEFVKAELDDDKKFIRDLFAAFAMNALVSDEYDSRDRGDMVEEAYLIADEMMDQR